MNVIGGAADDGDSDAWTINILQVREESLRKQLDDQRNKRREDYARWKTKVDRWVRNATVAAIAWSAGLAGYVAFGARRHNILTDLAVSLAIGLWLLAAVMFGIRILGERANKLHLGLDLELMLFDKLAARRGQQISTEVNACLAELTFQVKHMSGLIQGNNTAVAEAITRFLANGDREADTILEEVRGVMGGSLAAGGASVMPFARRPR